MKHQKILVKAIMNDCGLKKTVEEMVSYARENYVNYDSFFKTLISLDKEEIMNSIEQIEDLDDEKFSLIHNTQYISLANSMDLKALRPLQVLYVEYIPNNDEQDKYEDGKEYLSECYLTITSLDLKELNFGDVSRLKSMFFDKSKGDIECPSITPPYVKNYVQKIKNQPRK